MSAFRADRESLAATEPLAAAVRSRRLRSIDDDSRQIQRARCEFAMSHPFASIAMTMAAGGTRC
jgi:hypothetical protein